jgi:hypothetical protein
MPTESASAAKVYLQSCGEWFKFMRDNGMVQRNDPVPACRCLHAVDHIAVGQMHVCALNVEELRRSASGIDVYKHDIDIVLCAEGIP